MKTLKMASRYLIPMEMLIAIVLLSWGIAGWLCEGSLNESLREKGGISVLAWGIVLCLVAIFQFMSATIEWLYGRRWSRCMLLRFLHLRSMAAFLSMTAWVFAFYTVVTIPYKPAIFFTILIQCVAGFGFSMWSFIGNERARVVIDPFIPTSNFEKTIMVERSQVGDF